MTQVRQSVTSWWGCSWCDGLLRLSPISLFIFLSFFSSTSLFVFLFPRPYSLLPIDSSSSSLPVLFSLTYFRTFFFLSYPLPFRESPLSLFPCFVVCSNIQISFFFSFCFTALLVSFLDHRICYNFLSNHSHCNIQRVCISTTIILQRACNTTFAAVLQRVARCRFETLMGLANERLAPAAAIRLVQMRCCNRGASKQAS